MAAIEARLRGEQDEPTFEDKSEDFRRSLQVDRLEFVIMRVDVVGSTTLATTADPVAYRRAITTALYELSDVIPKFRGHVLKYTGDGIIAYFPRRPSSARTT
jgi:class 3 adenylate cyclase